MATRSLDKPPLMASASQPSYQGHLAQGHPQGITELLLPELGVDLQGLGEHLGPRVPHGVAADVQGDEAGVTAQSTQQNVGSQFEARFSHGQ